MRLVTRIAAWTAAVLIAVPAIVLIGGNTAPGRAALARLIGAISGGRVSVAGLAGRFPDRLSAARVTVRDEAGVWARIRGLRIDWSPLLLVRGVAKIDRLAAARVTLLRRPVIAAGAAVLPVPVAVDAIQVARLDLAAPVAGAAARFALRGSLYLSASMTGALRLAAERLDAAGRYRLAGTFGPAALHLELSAAEPAHGLIAALAGLPDLGPLAIAARLDGPPAAARARLTLAAGPLRAAARGTIDLLGYGSDLALTAAAPAMSPRAGLSWRSASLAARLQGRLAQPRIDGHLSVDGLTAAGVAIDRVRATLAGGPLRLVGTATLSGLRLPGPYAALFAAAPVTLQAGMRLDEPGRPVRFALSHPLFAISGRFETGAAPGGTATVILPSLGPLSALAGVALAGHAKLTARVATAGGETTLTAGGEARLDGGLPAALAVLGDRPRFRFAATWKRGGIALARATADGKSFHFSATGSQRAGVFAIDWRGKLADVSALAPMLAGRLDAAGRVSGSGRDYGLDADVTGLLGPAGALPQPFTARLRAAGLPAAPTARITAEGRLAGAPLRLAAKGRRGKDGALDLTIARAAWKSAALTGALSWRPGAAAPRGRVRLTVARLADLAPFVGARIDGNAEGRLALGLVQGRPQARLALSASKLGFAGAAAAGLTLAGTLAGPLRRPDLSLRLALNGIAAAGLMGDARLSASGPADRAAWRLTTALRTGAGAAVPFSAAGTVRPGRGELRLAALTIGYGGESWHLLAPARIGLAGGVTTDGLRLGSGGAVLSATGRLTPRLALALSLQNAGLALAAPILPVSGMAGTIVMTAALRGSLAAPQGIVRVSGRRLQFGGDAVPAADLDVTARLMGAAAGLSADLVAGGALRLRLSGTAPLRAGGPLALDLSGTADLAFLDPLLTASGRAARGRLTIAATLAGTPAAPRLAGTLRLAGGGFQDLIQGVHLSDIDGLAELAGDTLRLRQLKARAGAGSVAVAGTVGLAGGRPLALTITARHARLLASSLLTLDADAALSLRGRLAGRLDLAGRIGVDKAEIDIPAALPQQVAVLAVEWPGRQPRPSPLSRSVLGLDLDIVAPGRIRVRGRGLDAQMGGRLHIAGTTAQPQIRGALSLRRGAIDLAGQRLTFTAGSIGFDGRSLSGQLDPLLDFTAQSSANGITATLRITGYADMPKITLTSEPPLPQDEILAQLLYGQSVRQLSPLQLAQIGQAVAVLGGISGLDPLMAIRRDLGLDRLAVGGGAGKGGVTLEAGKYLTRRIYVGARQATSGGTQARLQIDLTRHLRLETTLGTGGGAPTAPITPSNDPGSSLGLSYQLEY